jgi:tRNA nucleotidyltransferase/poly(A) polymerase
MLEVRLPFEMEIPEDILAIKNVFQQNNYKLYVVGGAVRDALLGQVPKDFDLATDAIPDTVETMMEAAGFKTLPTGKSFGVINVFTDKGEYEIATFRSDQYKGDDLEGFKNHLKSLNNGSYEEFITKLMK